MSQISNTQFFQVENGPQIQAKDILEIVYQALREKGYNPVNQIVGYIMSGDPTYITSHNGARSLVMKMEREIEIRIYDKKYYDNTQLYRRPNYKLPVIRYGIYEKDGKKVCQIGSIQNTNFEDEKNDVEKKLEREKYKLNKDVDKEEVISIEPKNILALSLFINILAKEGITEIEVPSIYVLDYEYHQKRGKSLVQKLEKDWTKQRIEKWPEQYEREAKYAKNNFKKEDVISEIKTERFVKIFKRLLHHYPNGKVKSYPGELDNYFRLSIPVVKDENEIKGDLLRDIYSLVEEKYSEVER